VLRGDAGAALAQLDRLYQDGADPLLIMQDLLDLGHFLTRLKLAPEAGAGDPIAEGDRQRARPLAEKLSMPTLARLWQMLLKGLAEVQNAPSPIQAAEMIVVRLAYVADLPTPVELVRLAQDGAATVAAGASAPQREAGPPMPAATRPVAGGALRAPAGLREPADAPIDTTTAPPVASALEPMPQTFEEVLALFDQRREAVMRSHLATSLHLVHFERGHIECRLTPGAPANLANRLGQLLSEWTGTRWLVAISDEEGQPTSRQQKEAHERELRNEVAGDPLVQAVLETFPGARITAVRERFAAAPAETEEMPDQPDAEDGNSGEDGE
jgi:DNA polymerase-3 subunit gamma/tau